MRIRYVGDPLDLKNIIEDIKNKEVSFVMDSEDYILRKIREDYLSDSTVTIFLIGKHSSENLGEYEQRFIKRELQASLYHGKGNTKSGILGVVLPSMIDTVYGGSYNCLDCGGSHNYVGINDTTVIKEFSYNYYIPSPGKCSWSYDDRYCVVVKWSDFINNPSIYIDQAYNKRDEPISEKTRVKPQWK